MSSAGAAVQRSSRRVLPWIGGPSRCSSPGRIRKFRTEKQITTVTSTKIGTEAMIRTSHSVSILSACVEAAFGNQLMIRPRAMPTAEAMMLTTTICATVRRGALHAHGGQVLAEGGAADLGVCALELAARGGDAPGDVVQRQLGGVLRVDDGRGVLVEARAVANGGLTLHVSPCSTHVAPLAMSFGT